MSSNEFGQVGQDLNHELVADEADIAAPADQGTAGQAASQAKSRRPRSDVAQPYREGSGWAVRRRVDGCEYYESGHKSAAAARKAMQKRVQAQVALGKPKGLGPHRTTVAQAIQDWALNKLRFMKGAVQEANRANRWLRAAKLSTLKVSRVKKGLGDASLDSAVGNQQARGALFEVTLVPWVAERRVPKGLGQHRSRQTSATKASDQARRRLATMPMALVQRDYVQALMDELVVDGLSPASIALERALLRGLFNDARTRWQWAFPSENPATSLRMPEIDNDRTRVMSAEEQARIDEAIQECRNQQVGPAVTLLTETAMRTSEPLTYARWEDIDWERKTLNLRDSKTKSRKVPLSPRAIEALHELQALSPNATPKSHIVDISYESLKAAWQRCCDRAGVADLTLRDLRHTAATRMALKTGRNVWLVKALTGHKTMAMVNRYVNVSADDVVALMHAEPSDASSHTQEATASPSLDATSRSTRKPPKPVAKVVALGNAEIAEVPSSAQVIAVDFQRMRRAS